MWLSAPRMGVDLVLFLAATFGIMVIGRLISIGVPLEYYFTFQSIFSERKPSALVISALVRMLGPLLFCFAIGFFLFGRANAAASHKRSFAAFRRRLRLRWQPTIFLAGFLAAFLGAWPQVIYWDLLANPQVADLKAVFFVLYVVYMVAFGFVALLGFLCGVFVGESLGGTEPADKLVSTAEISRVGLLWLLNSGISSGALSWLMK